MQLVWTHLPMLDGVNNWAANFPGHFHIREESHAECKKEDGGTLRVVKNKHMETWKRVGFYVGVSQVRVDGRQRKQITSAPSEPEPAIHRTEETIIVS